MQKNKQKLIKAREACQEAKIGDTITCPSCSTQFVKKSYQSVFCKTKKGTKCKDNYWNNVDENKRNNTTRISPASAFYMARQSEIRRKESVYVAFGPVSGDDIGQWID